MYLWVKALHIICVIAWMAGMLYLPRLYVYHCGQLPGSETSELFKTMERRLLRYIINPAMIAVWLLGAWLVMIVGIDTLKTEGWFHAKLALLVLMQLIHAVLARCRRDFAHDRNRRTARFYRCLNESVTVVMIGIVILAVVKPF
jgi:putative membrane protein